jgi:hypothetical protein
VSLGLSHRALESGDGFGMMSQIVFEFRGPLIGLRLAGGQSGVAAVQVTLEIAEPPGLFLDLGTLGGQLLLACGQSGALALKLPAIVFRGLAVGQEALGFGVEGRQAGVEIGLGGSEVLLAAGKLAARLFEADLLLAGHLLLGGDTLAFGQEALLLGFEGGAAVGQGLPLGFQGVTLGGQELLGGLEFAAGSLEFVAQGLDLA